jgi:hypothetical protein
LEPASGKKSNILEEQGLGEEALSLFSALYNTAKETKMGISNFVF